MIKIFHRILLGFTVILFSCNGQKDKKKENATIIKNNKTTEKFDIDKFNKNQKEGEWKYIDVNGNNVYLRDVRDEYWEEISSKKTDYTIRNRYYHSGELKQTGQSFLADGAQKGIWIDYNIKGKIIGKIDYDIPFLN